MSWIFFFLFFSERRSAAEHERADASIWHCLASDERDDERPLPTPQASFSSVSEVDLQQRRDPRQRRIAVSDSLHNLRRKLKSLNSDPKPDTEQRFKKMTGVQTRSDKHNDGRYVRLDKGKKKRRSDIHKRTADTKAVDYNTFHFVTVMIIDYRCEDQR
jgi:hypothetical protein